MTKQNATCCLPFLFKFLHLTYNCYRHIHNFVLGSLSMLQSSLYHCYRHHIYNLSFGSSIDVTVKPLSMFPAFNPSILITQPLPSSTSDAELGVLTLIKFPSFVRASAVAACLRSGALTSSLRVGFPLQDT